MERRSRTLPPQNGNQSAPQQTYHQPVNTGANTNQARFQTGAAGMDQSRRETESAAAQFESMHSFDYSQRFWLKKGETANLVILDQSYENVFWAHEHHFRNPKTGKWNGLELCPKAFDVCPICEGIGGLGYDQQNNKADKPYYAMFLSVLDTRSYTKNDGTVVPFSRKLLVIKRGNGSTHDRYNELFHTIQQENGGRLRGAVLRMSRGNGATEPGHGEPSMIEGSGGRLFALVDEARIQQFTHDAITTKKGEVVVPANGLQQPIDYFSMVTEPTNAGISARWGLNHQPANNTSFDQQLYGGQQQTGADPLTPANNAPMDNMLGGGVQQNTQQAPDPLSGGNVQQPAQTQVDPLAGGMQQPVNQQTAQRQVDPLAGGNSAPPQNPVQQNVNVTSQQTDANGFAQGSFQDGFDDEIPF